uniref:Crinkler (CRN) family protein putative n=1 Tax=Albugo laibachii Nc14 TaxID=890382 RepID=F0WVH9_9STRA|nr:Crinkler (CRN) family protein putative [Albugo laibachii Nc14]|eukprot:CCA25421.1 Crinkler (CRN) family protein putative [Albugo laibachii Nc14]
MIIKAFFVDIDSDKRDLELYLTKQEDRWFPFDDLNNFRLESLSGMTLMDPFLPIIEYFGREFQPVSRLIHVFVDAPPPEVPSLAAVSPPETLALARLCIEPINTTIFSQSDFDILRKECIKFPTWEADTRHRIRKIWKFRKPSNECTSLGKILWRLEEQKVFSSIVGRWHRAISNASSFADMNLRSIVIGSPGIGKSMRLVLMAFYMSFKYKINVLIYRRVEDLDVENCLIYLGYEDGKAVHGAVIDCTAESVITIRKNLVFLLGKGKVRLVLDGFTYKDVPNGLKTFTLLGTSQQADIKSHNAVATKGFLLPSWSKKDLFFLG